MTVLAPRIIEVLKADTTLMSLLSDTNSIFIQDSPIKKEKYVVVSTGAGKDQNNIPADISELTIEAVVSRAQSNAHSKCIAIAERIDTLLNKGELNLTNSTYKVISLIRTAGTGLMNDDSTQEYWYELTYSYILDEST